MRLLIPLTLMGLVFSSGLARAQDKPAQPAQTPSKAPPPPPPSETVEIPTDTPTPTPNQAQRPQQQRGQPAQQARPQRPMPRRRREPVDDPEYAAASSMRTAGLVLLALLPSLGVGASLVSLIGWGVCETDDTNSCAGWPITAGTGLILAGVGTALAIPLFASGNADAAALRAKHRGEQAYRYDPDFASGHAYRVAGTLTLALGGSLSLVPAFAGVIGGLACGDGGTLDLFSSGCGGWGATLVTGLVGLGVSVVVGIPLIVAGGAAMSEARGKSAALLPKLDVAVDSRGAAATALWRF